MGTSRLRVCILAPFCLCVRWQDREISRLRTSTFELKSGLPDIASLFRELDKVAEANATHSRQVDLEINRLRTKLKTDLPDIETLCRQLEKAKTEAQRYRQQAEELRVEKSGLEKKMTEMKQKVTELHATHACQIDKQVLSCSFLIFLCLL